MKNFDLLNIFSKWRGALISVSVVSIVLSSIFSSAYFIKPKYKSTAIIYPSNIISYSQESPTEQMLQLFQSDSIFTHVLKQFNLIKHYHLDSSSPTIHHEVLATYSENISIRKTEYEAVRIDALDYNADTACEIINEMVKSFNSFTLNLGKAKTREQALIVKNLLLRKEMQIDSINLALKELGVKYGIIDYVSQSRELSKEYYRSLASGNERKINELTNFLRNLEERGGEYNKLQQYLLNITAEYSSLLNQHNVLENDLRKNVTYTNMVLTPYPADKKSYPIRWLIVTISTCSALLFSIIVIMVIEGKKNDS
jgi:hypothetical protein